MRLLLARVNVSLGLCSRGLWVVKNAIENVGRYVLEERRIESGEEPQNSVPVDQLRPMGMTDEGKKGGKAPPPTKEAEKKPTKGGKETTSSKEDL
jgi:hypothetical protein